MTLAVSVVFHYFNGGIQPQRGLPRVRPPVKAHISVLLALIALDKAAGYVLQRWSLVNAQDGYVNGAGYTDVHARLPAETLLDLRVDLRGGDPAVQHPPPGLDAARCWPSGSGPSWRWSSASSTRPCCRRSR